MRVGIDYLPAVTHAPGIGRYARELVRALVRLSDAPELALLEVGGGARRMKGASLGLEGTRFQRVRSRLPRRVVALIARAGLGVEAMLGRIDVFHRVQADWPPIERSPQVLPVPELPPPGSRAEAELAERARAMDAVLVFSSHYENEVARRLSLEPRRVHRVAVGCEHWLRDLGNASVARCSTPRVLVLGALREEREPLLVLAAFERLLSRCGPAELLFVGRPGSATERFEAALAHSPARARVRWIRDPLETDMPRTVAESSVLVHLAREEGTPVTPLEACAMGLAVLAAPLPAFEEALGSLGTWRAPGSSAEELSRGMEEALADARDGERTAARRQLACEYTWARNAASTVALWQEVAGIRPTAPTQPGPNA